MAIGVKYSGTQAELIEHLRSLAADHTNRARSLKGADKASQLGAARGLEHAAYVLERWTPTTTADAPALDPGDAGSNGHSGYQLLPTP